MPHSRVWVSVSLLEKDSRNIIQISVKDEGQGLTKDDLSKLFGKFVRLSARPTAGESSTGLGLSIAKKMIEMLGGNIYCESEYGKGSTFFVDLPIVTDLQEVL